MQYLKIMAHVPPSSPLGPPHKPPPTEVLQISPQAIQVTSKEALLAQIARENPLKGIPVLGWIAGKIVRSSVKKEYIKKLETHFILKAQELGYSEKEAEYHFSILKPKLSKTHLEDLVHFEKALVSKGGAACFATIFKVFQKEHFSTLKQNLYSMVDLIIKASEINSGNTAKMIETFPKVAFMLQDRFTPQQHYEYLKLSLLAVINADKIQIRGLPHNTTIIDEIQTFVNQAEQIQNERPQIYYNNPAIKGSVTPENQRKLNSAYGSIFSLPSVFRFLADASKEILDMTLLMNEQVIHENIRLNFRDLSFNERTMPLLEKREDGYDFGTSREFHRNVTPFEKPDQRAFFEAGTDIYLTNEKTMETRSVHLKLPFSGEMTQTMSDHLLSFLEEVFKRPDEFDQHFEKLSEEERSFIEKEKVFSWMAEVKSHYALALFDLNSTKKRPKMASAREEKTTQRAIQNPIDGANGLLAAQQKNIYNIKGQLSLLPEEVAAQQPQLAFINQHELRSAQNQFRSNNSKPVPFSLAEDRDATLSLKYEKITIEGQPLIKLETTIQKLGRSHTRETFYKLKAQESVAQKIESIIASKLFERDLLLAKAEALSAGQKRLENLQKEFIHAAQASGISSSAASAIFDKVQADPDGIEKALLLFPKVLFLMQERFNTENKQQFLEQLLMAAQEPSDIDCVNDFITAAELLQKERGAKIYVADLSDPKVYAFAEKESEVRSLSNDLRFLKNVMAEISDMTCISNIQTIHDSIHLIYDPSSRTGRIKPILYSRYHHPFTTSVEYPPPRLTLYSDRSDEIDFQVYTDLYLTNEKTMETRAVHVKLPFSGKISQTTARKLLAFLYRVISGENKEFDRYLAESDLSAEEKSRFINKQAILDWVDNLTELYGKALFDLNATPDRPKMSFAKESVATKAAIEDPQDPKKSILAAAERNIYNIEGALSLLPPEVAKYEPKIAFLGIELSPLATTLVQNRSAQMTIALSPDMQNVEMRVDMQHVEIEDNFFLELDTTLTSGTLSHTRKTLYPLDSPMTVEERVGSLLQSHHLERDLLLAKAEFYEKL